MTGMARRVDRSVARAEEGNLRQGRMTSHRRIFLTVAIGAAVPVSMPALAVANSLLSGYGGPGQGSQAILGSALLGGGTGGGGAGGGSTGGGLGVSPGPPNLSEPSGGAGSSASATTDVGNAPTRKATGGASSSGHTGAGAVQSETLGLSGDDLLYVLLALAAVAFTGVLTRRLARMNDPDKNNG